MRGCDVQQDLTVYKDKLYFRANGAPSSASYDWELWASDGTDAGTKRVKDILSGSKKSLPVSMRARHEHRLPDCCAQAPRVKGSHGASSVCSGWCV